MDLLQHTLQLEPIVSMESRVSKELVRVMSGCLQPPAYLQVSIVMRALLLHSNRGDRIYLRILS